MEVKIVIAIQANNKNQINLSAVFRPVGGSNGKVIPGWSLIKYGGCFSGARQYQPFKHPSGLF
jgi:hypothetical protein